jgi:hypothetical protein
VSDGETEPALALMIPYLVSQQSSPPRLGPCLCPPLLHLPVVVVVVFVSPTLLGAFVQVHVWV